MMGNQTSASGVRSRTTTSGGAAQQQQTQRAEHEYDPYVQGGVSDALCRIWMHGGGERLWSGIRILCVMDAYPVYG